VWLGSYSRSSVPLSHFVPVIILVGETVTLDGFSASDLENNDDLCLIRTGDLCLM